VMAGLWGLTDHVMAGCNENLLQMNPLALLVLPGMVGWRKRGRFAKLAGRAALVVAVLSGLGLVLQALPGLDQVNGPVIALALPAQVGIAAGLRRLIGRRRWQPESPA
jgi:ABC-type Mn2+/Zn2+ transport system permease subunit